MFPGEIFVAELGFRYNGEEPGAFCPSLEGLALMVAEKWKSRGFPSGGFLAASDSASLGPIKGSGKL